MKSTSEQHARRLAILAGLLSQEHARILVGQDATDHKPIAPRYLAELLFLNTGLGDAVITWATQSNIPIEQGAPKVDAEAYKFPAEVMAAAKGVQLPNIQTRRVFLALVPKVDKIIADTVGAAASNLGAGVAASEADTPAVKFKL